MVKVYYFSPTGGTLQVAQHLGNRLGALLGAEEASKNLRQKDKEMDEMRRQATLKTRENQNLLADLKAQMLEMRKAVKARYPQSEWINFGVQDKR